MDVQMPEMSGLDATAAIRARERATGAHTPIISMTAHAMSGDREQCLTAGMDAYLSKPLRPHDLMAAIDALLTAGPDARAERPAAAPRDTPAAAIDEARLLDDFGHNGNLLAQVIGVFLSCGGRQREHGRETNQLDGNGPRATIREISDPWRNRDLA